MSGLARPESDAAACRALGRSIGAMRGATLQFVEGKSRLTCRFSRPTAPLVHDRHQTIGNQPRRLCRRLLKDILLA
jgi:hypothetical protein